MTPRTVLGEQRRTRRSVAAARAATRIGLVGEEQDDEHHRRNCGQHLHDVHDALEHQ
jgi:hypothetical protein